MSSEATVVAALPGQEEDDIPARLNSSLSSLLLIIQIKTAFGFRFSRQVHHRSAGANAAEPGAFPGRRRPRFQAGAARVLHAVRDASTLVATQLWALTCVSVEQNLTWTTKQSGRASRGQETHPSHGYDVCVPAALWGAA